MAKIEIVTIGTELLLGHLIDTNSAHIASTLADHGVDVFAKHSVGDNAERLEVMLRESLSRADGVITTGGLGPTVDDLTKDAVARAAETTLDLHEPSLHAIEAFFSQLGRVMSENNRRQAILPRGAYVLENPHGTAPGFITVRGDGKFIACMPGVPREMKPMLAERLMPWLTKRYGLEASIYTRILHTVGIGESDIDRRIEDLFRALENPKIAVLAHGGRVDVKIMAKAQTRAEADALFAPVEAELRTRIGPGIYGTDAQTLEGAIIAALVRRQLTLATAESITGGAVADSIIRSAGASAAFRGGVVAYDDAVKIQLLGVDPALIREHGAVSEPVARAMAHGACKRLGANYGIAATGIAGPGGATPGKPVGLVYVALAAPSGTIDVRRVTFPGERADVRARTTMLALNLLWRDLDT